MLYGNVQRISASLYANFSAKIQNNYELCIMNYKLFRNFAPEK